MKAVLMSIKPQWCELIASGKKTVEIRKNKPNLEVPFKVYIYCTKDNTFADKTLRGFDENGKAIYYRAHKGKVIGEFVCDAIFPLSCYYSDTNAWYVHSEQPFTCLTDKEMIDYLGNGVEGYGWHITDLIIYDKPRELVGFYHYCGDNPKCDGCNAHYYSNTECGKEDYCCSPMEGCKPITRPFQSWGYVEEVEDNER